MDDELKKLIERLKTTDPELYALAQNESSGGINLNYPIIHKGINKGHKAGGPFGMTPTTAKEIVNRNPANTESYPDIKQFNPEEVSNILNNDYDTAIDLARQEYLRRLSEFGGDKARAAHSWLYGVSGTKNTPEEDIQNNEYVQKFLKNLPKQKN